MTRSLAINPRLDDRGEQLEHPGEGCQTRVKPWDLAAQWRFARSSSIDRR